MVVHEVFHGPCNGFGEVRPANGREALLLWDFNLDSIDESAIERSVCLHVVSARVVSIASRAGEDGGRHDTVGLVAQVVAEAVWGRFAKQIFEACVVCGIQEHNELV